MGTNGEDGTPMGEMNTEGQRGGQKRSQAEDAQSGINGPSWGDEDRRRDGTKKPENWTALDRSREGNGDRGSEVGKHEPDRGRGLRAKEMD